METIKFLQSFSSPLLDRLFILITMTGEDIFIIPMITLMLWCVNKKLGYRMGFAYIANSVVSFGLKELFRMPRPIGQPGIFSLRVETATGYSFPSGHTESAASVWTSLMLHAGRLWVYITGVLLIMLVAVSRLYLGVHYPADVIAGAVLGVCIAIGSNAVIEYAENKDRRIILLVFIIPVLAGGFFVQSNDYYKALGAVISFFIGYLIDSKYIRYTVDGALWKQIVKYIVGLAVLLGIKTLIKPLLPEAPISDFCRYFLMGSWATVFAPLLFKLTLGGKVAPRG